MMRSFISISSHIILTLIFAVIATATGQTIERAALKMPAFAPAINQTNKGLIQNDGSAANVRAPYHGPVVKGVNTKTLTGKVMCGYQGWFGAPGDGSSEQAWRHWTKNRGPLADGNAKIDLWPDVSELDANQRFPTGFKMADGNPAEVFSSFERPTVLKHFEWMQEYGIDGVFVQRFANGLKNQPTLGDDNTVLASCREGANLHGRTYAVMYDLTGLLAGHIDDVINDWRALKNQMVITEDPAYLNHRGKPVVAIWGVRSEERRVEKECRSRWSPYH